MSDVPAVISVPARPRRSGLVAWLATARARRAEDEAIRRSRERLAEYDDHLLRDIGMTREEALRHAPRRAWDAPDWWKMAPSR